MAIDFVHYHDTDLAIHTWTHNFRLREFLLATRTYLLDPARFEIVDIRRLNLASITSRDLFKLSEYLHSAYQSKRHISGKTAIVYHEEMPPSYSRSQRLFHNFSIWTKEHQLPRDFALFPSMAEAVAWLGSRHIQAAHCEALARDRLDEAADQALSA